MTSLTKIDAGCYRVTINGRPAGSVEKNEETNEWEASWKGCLVGYGRTRREAVGELELRQEPQPKTKVCWNCLGGLGAMPHDCPNATTERA